MSQGTGSCGCGYTDHEVPECVMGKLETQESQLTPRRPRCEFQSELGPEVGEDLRPSWKTVRQRGVNSIFFCFFVLFNFVLFNVYSNSILESCHLHTLPFKLEIKSYSERLINGASEAWN